MRSKNKWSITICILLIFSFFSNVQAITIDGSSISVKEGQTYNWIYTAATDMVNASDRVKFKIDNLYKGNFSTEKVAILNATIDYYNSYNNSWEQIIENEQYMYFNETTDFLYYTPGFMFVYGWIFVVPIPLNLTLLGDFLNATVGGQLDPIVVIGNQLILQDIDDEITLSFIFNENGILLRYDILEADTTIITFEFTGLSSEQGISLGYTFILIMAISMIGIVVYRKRKLKFT